MGPLSHKEIAAAVRAALAEDVGPGDVTTDSLIPENSVAAAEMAAREEIVVCGLEFAAESFRALSELVRIDLSARDGERLPNGGILLRVHGPARAILTGERTALNFVQRLSGIASGAARFVAEVKGTRAQILDTRKTTPGWRAFEKYAVACGGARNHRAGLHDMVLIKDNHLHALRNEKPNAIAAAVRLARARHPALKVEVEADTLAQACQARDAGADIILLDNMSLDQLREAVSMIGGRCQTEASGGVTLSSLRAIAQTGVDFISSGALTHSARAADIGLDFVEWGK